jgi:extracellular factor (EF) 3-hydroxypalmitic acid methyl ester biosynthesis protein
VPNKVIIVRQDRWLVEDLNIFVRSGSTSIQVLDLSAFGLALFSTQELPQELNQVSIEIENIEISQVDLLRVRIEPYHHKDVNGFKVAYHVLGNPLSVERMMAVKDTNALLAEHAALFSKYEIPEAFKLVTYEVKNWLSLLEEKVNQIEKTSFDQPIHKLNPFVNVVTEMVAEYIDENIRPLYKKLEQITNSLDPKTIKMCFQFFRESVGDFLFQSSYANRAYQKPRGYAGDFEMMTTVYHAEIRGKTLFGKCVERYFINVPEAQAVRNRTNYLIKCIVKKIGERQGPVKIMSLACGPANEIQKLICESPDLLTEQVEIHFIDQDLEALKECQKAVEQLARQHGVKAKFKFHNWAVKNVIESGLEIKDLDLIYSAGLFDYLSDPVAQYAARQLILALHPTGQAIIGNFDVSAPNRFGMTLVTDWNLIYRTADDLHRLFSPIATVFVEKEDLGINLFAILSRN